jgi:ribosomal protein L7/L12
MNPDRPPSDMDLVIRNVRWLIAAFKAWRNTQGLPFKEAMEQLGHSANGPEAGPAPRGVELPAPAAAGARARLARQAAQMLKRQAETRAALQSQGGALPAPVLEAMAKGQKIEAIRLLRAHTGLGLKEAKDAVEAHAGAAPAATPLQNPASALAPGQVPTSDSSLWIWIVAALGVAGMLLYRFWPGWSA